MDQGSINKRAKMTPSEMSLDASLNNNHITVEQNPILEETEASRRPSVKILNMKVRISAKKNAVEPNPIEQNTIEQVPRSIPVAQLPYGMVPLSFVNEAQLNQSGEPAMSSSTGKNIVVVNEKAMQQNSLPSMLNEGHGNASTRQIITEEENQEDQLDYNQNVSTIEVPLITGPNSSNILVKFRPGIYKGDAIPPVYSNFNILAVDKDYMPQIPASVQPDISLIPEPIYEEQVITENETTNDTEHFFESDGKNFVVDNQGRSLADLNATQISEQPIQLLLTGLSGGRIIDARLLVTLRNTRLILIYKGYHFRRYYFQGLKIRWQCVDQKCSAYLYSYENKVTVVYSVHNHLGILRDNSPKNPTELKAVYTLEEAMDAVTGLGAEKDQNADPSVLVSSNMETMTLSYTYETATQTSPPSNANILSNINETATQTSPPPDENIWSHTNETAPQTSAPPDENIWSHSNETAPQTSPPPKENISPSRLPPFISLRNTEIYHDPSLEITEKDSSGFQENYNTHAMFSGSENTITSVLDLSDHPSIEITVTNSSGLQEDYNTHSMLTYPVLYCDVTQNNAGSSHQVRSGPKHVRAKVTLTSIPQISEPQVYYDGKPAKQRKKN